MLFSGIIKQMENTQPGQELIQSLETLRTRLNSSGTERTSGLLRELGQDCGYFRKSLDIFLRKDFDELLALVERCNSLMNEIK